MNVSFSNDPDFRARCADQLSASFSRASQITAFVGLDGFVDEIVHAVDKRFNAHEYKRLPTIASMAERVAGAAGKSTNIEMVNQRTKLGGNGPIMANALASLGLRVTYVGALGFPNMHPVFEPFAARADVHSIAEAGHTDALEFEDGKVMLVKSISLNDVTWKNLQERYGQERFAQKFAHSDLIGFVNWTMIPKMTELWEALLAEVCPKLNGPRRKIFFDLADPAKRSSSDICQALEVIGRFQEYFDVILGLNEKEAVEVAQVAGINLHDNSREGLARLGWELHCKLKIDTLVIHPVTYALAVQNGQVDLVAGPYVPKPLITTGAGDHFNSGFCMGKLLGLNNAQSLLTGVATSGFYVRTAQSPAILDLASMMRAWPAQS